MSREIDERLEMLIAIAQRFDCSLDYVERFSRSLDNQQLLIWADSVSDLPKYKKSSGTL